MRWSNYNPHRRIPILMYHQIAETNLNDDPLQLGVSPYQFAAQMAFLTKHGIRSLSLDQFQQQTQQQTQPQKAVVISFDDGFADNYHNAFPILQQYGLTASIFLVSQRVGQQRDWEQTPVPLLNWQQIQEMSAHGIEFQSHTAHHIDMRETANDLVKQDLILSKQTIEDTLGKAVNHLAYPYGRYTDKSIELAQSCGYQHAYAAGMANNQPFEQARFCMTGQDSFNRFRWQSSLWGDFLRYWKIDLG